MLRTVTSADGTDIAVEVAGSGPPLVLVHGGGVTREFWDPIRPHLTGYTLYLPDRRGRGDSGDAPDHSLEREVDDLRAVLDLVDGNPLLFGHSFGGLVALATARNADVERLVLYEPAILTAEDRGASSIADEMRTLLADGERRRAVKHFFREATGAENVERWPIWPDCVALAETIERENRAVQHYALDDARVDAPTLVLLGERGPADLHAAARALHATLPDSRLVELDGVGHAGVSTSPERVADALSRFLRPDDLQSC